MGTEFTIVIRDEGLQVGGIDDQLHQLVPATLESLQLGQRAEVQDLHFIFANLQLGQVLSTRRENENCTPEVGYWMPDIKIP